MTALIVLGSILVVLLVILMIPVGGEAEYAQTGLSLALKLGPVTVPLYPKAEPDPAKKKQKKTRLNSKKSPQKNQKKEPAPKEKPGGSFQLFRQLLPIFCAALGKLKQRLKLSFVLHYTAGGEDAAQTAVQFGTVSAGLGGVIALLENHFCIQKREVITAVDFNLSQPVIYLLASVRIRIGQVLYLAIRYGIACLRVYLTHRREQTEQKKKKAV